MALKRHLSDAKAINQLAEFLSRCPEVSQLNQGKYNEAGVLAHTFSDLEDSFSKLLSEHFPKLAKREIKESEIKDCLLEIGEELRHILYHINDPKFYKYLEIETNKRDGHTFSL